MLKRFFCLAALLPMFVWASAEPSLLYDDDAVADLITVIVTTNPIPSIPKTDYVYDTVASLYRVPALAKCKKIIVFDGIQPSYLPRESDYNEYKANVVKLVESDTYFSNVELIFLDRWSHLVGAMTEVLKHVTTPFIFVQQHDILLQKDVDMNGLVATMMANPIVKYVHFSKNPNKQKSGYIWWVEKNHEFSYVPLCKFYGWTDLTHIARVDYYRDFVLPQCEFGFMERFLYKNFKKAFKQLKWDSHTAFGTYLYGELSDGNYIFHADGRKG